VILLISASWVAGITGVSHQHPATYTLHFFFWLLLVEWCVINLSEVDLHINLLTPPATPFLSLYSMLGHVSLTDR
jgi:hypothetical protein